MTVQICRLCSYPSRAGGEQKSNSWRIFHLTLHLAHWILMVCHFLIGSTVRSLKKKKKKKVLTAFYVTGTGPGSGDTSEQNSATNGKRSRVFAHISQRLTFFEGRLD